MGVRVIFANRFFHPDLSATSQMLSDLALRLPAAGVATHVVCSRQLYDQPGARLAAREQVRGIEVHRVWSTRFGRGHLAGRVVDYLSFYAAATVRLLLLARRGDILVMKTDPPLLSVVGSAVAAARGAMLVNWLQDVFPEVATRLYGRAMPRWVAGCVRWLRDRSLRKARINVVLGPGMSAFVGSRGVAPGRVRLIENWADGASLRPIAPATSRLRRELGLTDRFVVAYSGNLGRAHEFETFLGAAEALRGDPRFAFLMIGDGARAGELRAQVAARRLTSFTFAPYQRRETLADSLGAADVHLVCLRPELEGLIVPSKTYGVLAAGRPAVFIGDPLGDTATVLREGRCGLSVQSGDAAGLAHALQSLQADATTVQAMGERARELFESRFSVDGAVSKWLAVLAECGLQVAEAPQAPANAPAAVRGYESVTLT